MASKTHGNNIQPVLRIVSKMMMVVDSWHPALRACVSFYWEKFSLSNCNNDGVLCLSLKRVPELFTNGPQPSFFRRTCTLVCRATFLRLLVPRTDHFVRRTLHVYLPARDALTKTSVRFSSVSVKISEWLLNSAAFTYLHSMIVPRYVYGGQP